jgi:hypothetical protein
VKRLVALFVLLFVGSASAAPQCWPKPFGTGSFMVTSTTVEPNEFGEWAYWFCPDPFKVSFVITTRAKGTELRVPVTEGMTVTQTLQAIWDANVKVDLLDDKVIALTGAAVGHIEAHMPARPKWVVAKNGTTTTRPVYLRKADGTRSTSAVSGVRATVGAPCTCDDPARRVGDGTTATYCDPRAVTPVVVTLCTRLP